MAADARLDVLSSLLNQLCNPLRIDEELTSDCNRINPSVLHSLRTYLRIHPARADYRNIHKVLYMRNILKVAVFRHVLRRMRPVPCIVGAVVAVEHIIARILQVFCRALRLCHVTTDLRVVSLSRHRPHAEALGF